MRFKPLDPDDPIAEQYGVGLAIAPTDATYPIEAFRAPDFSGLGIVPVTGAAESLGSRIYRAAGDVFIDTPPHDDTVWWYQFRQIVPGIDNGLLTAWYGLRADIIPVEYQGDGSTIYPVRRDKPMHDALYVPIGNVDYRLTSGLEGDQNHIGGSLFVDPAEAISFGTVAAPSVKSRPVLIEHAKFHPTADNKNFAHQSAWVSNRSGGGDCVLVCTLDVPEGCDLTSFSTHSWKNGAGDLTQFDIYRVESDTWTLLAQHIPTGTGAWQTATTALAETASAGRYYKVVATLTSSVNDGARIGWASYDHEFPTYDQKGR